MDMGIHCFGGNTISIISQLLGSSPFAGKGFYITVVYGIFDFALHGPVKLYGFLQAFIVACCSEMFGQTVDGIRAAVSLLVRIQWSTVCFYQPIYASILRVDEVVYEIALRPVSQFAVGSIAIHPIGG